MIQDDNPIYPNGEQNNDIKRYCSMSALRYVDLANRTCREFPLPPPLLPITGFFGHLTVPRKRGSKCVFAFPSSILDGTEREPQTSTKPATTYIFTTGDSKTGP